MLTDAEIISELRELEIGQEVTYPQSNFIKMYELVSQHLHHKTRFYRVRSRNGDVRVTRIT